MTEDIAIAVLARLNTALMALESAREGAACDNPKDVDAPLFNLLSLAVDTARQAKARCEAALTR